MRSRPGIESAHTTSFFDSKYRKNVRLPMPAARAMSSTVVASNPWSANSAKATRSSSSRLVALRLPARAGGACPMFAMTLSL